MSQKYWFRPKSYGFGLMPINAKGWIAVFCLVCLVWLSFWVNGFFAFDQGLTLHQIGRIVIDFFVLLGAFHGLFHGYVDGEVRWKWGK